MRRLLSLMLLLLATNLGHLRADSTPRLYVWEGNQLAKTKAALANPTPELERATKVLKRQAEKALHNESYSVTYNEFVAPSGDKHDYVSFGAYWWPDPTKKDGLPFIRRDGETNREQKKLGDKDAFNEFSRDIQTLSLAYYFLEDERYAEHAIHLLNDWFLNPKTLMNPHLEYAQAVLGRNHGKSTGIIDTRDLMYVLDSMELLKVSSAFTPELAQGLERWFTQFLDWLRTSEHGKHEGEAPNNHGAWYQAQVMRIALYLGDEKLAREKLEHVRDNLIPVQIVPDGTQPQELARTNSFHYSLFNLMALGTIARMGESLDEDLWNYETEDGCGMRKAAEFLLPYVTGPAAWPHQQISKYEVSPLTNQFLRTLSVRYQEPRWLNVSPRFLENYSSYDPSLFVTAAYQEAPQTE